MKITVNKKEFTFAKATLEFVREITDKGYEEKFLEEFNEAIQDTKKLKIFTSKWKKFCLTAFEKKWWWAFYLPKELRFDNLTIVEAAKTLKNFFDYARQIQTEFTALWQSSMASKTETKST